MPQRPQTAAPLDAELAAQVAAKDHGAFETLMRRHNGRLFRVARAILKDDRDAEDALQDAYLDAYRHIGDFRGDSELSTWLTRIVVNQSLMRLRRQRKDRVIVPFQTGESRDSDQPEVEMPDKHAEAPSDAASRAEVRRLLERRIDELPLSFRTVFIMRDVEELTVQETADCLSIPPATVRTRLFRARALLRAALARDMDSATIDVFGFAGARCDRIVAGVLARL